MIASDAESGVPIVLTAPLTEIIDHAGYFIQMALASLPVWLEWILDKKYPKWREVERNADGSAKYMPAGLRVLVYPDPDKIGKQIKYADGRGIPYVAILGDDELKAGTVTVKDLKAQAQQTYPQAAAGTAIFEALKRRG